MSDEHQGCLRSGCRPVILLAMFLPVFLFFLASLLALSSWPFEAAYHLLIGAFIHAGKNLPPFLANWPKALFPLACLAVAIFLGHRLVRWAIITSGSKLHWRAGHTLAVAGMLLLGSAAAIALSGVAHQAAWLGQSPLIESYRPILRSVAGHKAERLLRALTAYRDEHGQYPESFEEIVKTGFVLTEALWVEPSDRTTREPFVLLVPGAKGENGNFPVIISPVLQPQKVVIVGYSSGEVKEMPLDEWQAMDRKGTPHD